MDEETIELLKFLADKLGTTTEHLWSVLLNQAFLSGLFSTAFLNPEYWALNDGMNGIVFNDDSQIVGMSVRKQYSQIPGVHVSVVDTGRI